MGMAASQVRLLQLTSRNNDIGRQLEHLSLEKMSLTREMQKVSKNYQNSLSAKVLKISNNAGVTYVDLSYSTLMKPNAYNNNTPCLLSDDSGKVILNDKYADYARLISPDGKAGGDWESHREDILSSLTGISKDKLASYTQNANAVDSASEDWLNAQTKRDKALDKAQKYYSAERFAAYIGQVGNINFESPDVVNLGSRTDALSFFQSFSENVVKNMQNYLSDSDLEELKKTCDAVVTTYSNTSLSSDEVFNNVNNNSASAIQKDGNNATINVKQLIDTIFSNYAGTQKSTSDGSLRFAIVKKDSAEYEAYLQAEADLKSAKESYDSSMQAKNQTFNGAEQTQINFYEQLFTAIVENGWREDSAVEDNDYLNQKLQNNSYYVTTMEVNDCYCPGCENSSCKYQYNYNQNLATNMDNIYTLNDENIRQEALTEYEYEKSVINSKESKIDQRMKNLETEQSAIQKMIQGIEQVKKDNTETYFSIFS